MKRRRDRSEKRGPDRKREERRRTERGEEKEKGMRLRGNYRIYTRTVAIKTYVLTRKMLNHPGASLSE